MDWLDPELQDARRWCAGVPYSHSRELSPEERAEINLRIVRLGTIAGTLGTTSFALFLVALAFQDWMVRAWAILCAGAGLLLCIAFSRYLPKLVRSRRAVKVVVYDGEMIDAQTCPLQLLFRLQYGIHPGNRLCLSVTSETALVLSANQHVVGPWHPQWAQSLTVATRQEGTTDGTSSMSDAESIEFRLRYSRFASHRRVVKVLIGALVVLIVATWAAYLIRFPVERMVPLVHTPVLVVVGLVIVYWLQKPVDPRLYRRDLEEKLLRWDASGKSAVLNASGAAWVVEGQPAGWRLAPASTLPDSVPVAIGDGKRSTPNGRAKEMPR